MVLVPSLVKVVDVYSEKFPHFIKTISHHGCETRMDRQRSQLVRDLR